MLVFGVDGQLAYQTAGAEPPEDSIDAAVAALSEQLDASVRSIETDHH